MIDKNIKEGTIVLTKQGYIGKFLRWFDNDFAIVSFRNPTSKQLIYGEFSVKKDDLVEVKEF